MVDRLDDSGDLADLAAIRRLLDAGPPQQADSDPRATALAHLALVAEAERTITAALDRAVEAAAAAGADWGDVGRATGRTRQGARQRWLRLVAPATPTTTPATPATLATTTPVADKAAGGDNAASTTLVAIPKGASELPGPSGNGRSGPIGSTTNVVDADEPAPLLAVVDLADRIEPGWRLVQTAGDREVGQWRVQRAGDTVGLVRRHTTPMGNHRGWTAWILGEQPRVLDDPPAGSALLRRNGSPTDLWRTRDLAAAGVSEAVGAAQTAAAHVATVDVPAADIAAAGITAVDAPAADAAKVAAVDAAAADVAATGIATTGIASGGTPTPARAVPRATTDAAADDSGSAPKAQQRPQASGGADAGPDGDEEPLARRRPPGVVDPEREAGPATPAPTAATTTAADATAAITTVADATAADTVGSAAATPATPVGPTGSGMKSAVVTSAGATGAISATTGPADAPGPADTPGMSGPSGPVGPVGPSGSVGPVAASLRDARSWQPKWLSTRTTGAARGAQPEGTAAASPGPRTPSAAAASRRAARIEAAAGALARHWPDNPEPDQEPIPAAATALVDASSRGRSRGARHTHAANAIRPFWPDGDRSTERRKCSAAAGAALDAIAELGSG